jgi:REP element-mobilizing transposase RayT
MARRPRLQLPGGIYHVMSRGNRKAPIFDDDDDRRRFLDVVADAAVRYDVGCYAYCLMGNHYHLLVTTRLGNLSRAMKHVNGVFTQASNRRHRRTGHLFEGRFHSLIVENEGYLRDVVRYVVLNPVRAGLVDHPAAWPWSSHRGTAGLEPAPPFLDVAWLDLAIGGASREERRMTYCAFVDSPRGAELHPAPNELAVGGVDFERALREAAVDGSDERLPRSHRALARPSLQELFGSGRQSLAVRNALMYEAHVTFAYSLGEIGTFLGLHRRTVGEVTRSVKRQRTSRFAT